MIDMAEKFCSNCGEGVTQEDTFCPECGNSLILRELASEIPSDLDLGQPPPTYQRDILRIAAGVLLIVCGIALGLLTPIPLASDAFFWLRYLVPLIAVGAGIYLIIIGLRD